MKCLSSKASTVGIFFAATVLLIFYLLSTRWNIYLPVLLFWLAVVVMLGTIVYQSLTFKLSSGYAGVVLVEIAIACVALHLIYQIPYYGLRGSDAYGDMASVKSILSSGFIMGNPEYVTVYSPWPMIHILGTNLSLITGIELFAVVKWFPSFIGVALILLLYLLVRNTFKNERAALLSALLFACLQQYILFGSLFIRETIALVLMICCLYLYFSARSSSHTVACYALSIVCLAGTTLAHHFTSFMLAAFLLIHFLVTRAASLPALKKKYFRGDVIGQKVGIIFLLLAFIFPVAFWASGGIQPPSITASAVLEPEVTTAAVMDREVTTIAVPEPGGTARTLAAAETGGAAPPAPRVTAVAYPASEVTGPVVLASPGGPIEVLIRFLRTLFSPEKWGSGYADMAGISFGDIQTTRGLVLFLGFWFFIAIFGAILLHRLLPRARNPRLETYSFTLFLFACGLLAFLGLYFIPMLIYPDRFLTFGFLFGFPPLVIAILHFNRRWLRRIGIGLLIAFLFFNIYWIEPTAWDARAEGVPAAPSQQDYALANRFDFSKEIIVGHANSLMAIYDVDNNRGIPTYNWGRVKNLSEFEWVIVQKEALRLEQKYRPEEETGTTAEIEQLMKGDAPDRNRIYESNTLAVFKRSS